MENLKTFELFGIGKKKQSEQPKEKNQSTNLINLLTNNNVKIEKTEKKRSEIFSNEKDKLTEKIKKTKNMFDLKKYRLLFGKESVTNLAKEIGINCEFN